MGYIALTNSTLTEREIYDEIGLEGSTMRLTALRPHLRDRYPKEAHRQRNKTVLIPTGCGLRCRRSVMAADGVR